MFNGFTLIEIILVLGLTGLIIASSQFFIVPVLTAVTCINEAKKLETVLVQARFLSQFTKDADIRLDILPDKYQLTTLGGRSEEIIDEYIRSQMIEVVPDHTIIFNAGMGEIEPDIVHIHIGSSSTCSRAVTINHDGIISNE